MCLFGSQLLNVPVGGIVKTKLTWGKHSRTQVAFTVIFNMLSLKSCASKQPSMPRIKSIYDLPSELFDAIVEEVGMLVLILILHYYMITSVKVCRLSTRHDCIIIALSCIKAFSPCCDCHLVWMYQHHFAQC